MASLVMSAIWLARKPPLLKSGKSPKNSAPFYKALNKHVEEMLTERELPTLIPREGGLCERCAALQLPNDALPIGSSSSLCKLCTKSEREFCEKYMAAELICREVLLVVLAE
jgi:hypothetical protein